MQTPGNIANLYANWTLEPNSPWVGAKDFDLYWRTQKTTNEYSINEIVNNTGPYSSFPINIGDVVQMTKYNSLYGYVGCFSMYIGKMPADPSVSSNKGLVEVTMRDPDLKDEKLWVICYIEGFQNTNCRVKFYDFT